jgi:hypothetical protein
MPKGAAVALIVGLVTAAGARGESYTLSPPIEKGQVPREATPLRKEEAKVREEAARVYSETIFVEGRDPDRRMPPPRSVEQKFADALNAGNPEVPNGWIRHGVFYDGVFYWGADPLSFIYYNVKNRLAE